MSQLGQTVLNVVVILVSTTNLIGMLDAIKNSQYIVSSVELRLLDVGE